jgi:hypothetical protein
MEFCTVQLSKSPVYRKSRAATAVRGKVACQKATDAFCVVSLGHLSQFGKAREKSENYKGFRLARRFYFGGSMQLRLAGPPELHVELPVERSRARSSSETGV